MKKFLAIYHIPADADEWMKNSTPEEQAAGMQKWMDWKAAHEGNIVDFGAPLVHAENLGNGAVHGTISGYSVLQAESLEALKEACKDHPHVGWHDDAYIELFSFAEM